MAREVRELSLISSRSRVTPLLIGLTCLWAGAFAASLHSFIHPTSLGSGGISVARSPTDDHPIVIDVSRFYGPRALQRGDRVIELGGVDLRGAGPIGFYARYVALAPPGKGVEIIYERDGSRSKAMLLAPFRTWPPLLASLGFAACGLFVALRAAATPLTRATQHAFLLMAIATTSPIAGGVLRNYAGLVAIGLIWPLALPAFVRTLQLFPNGEAPTTRWARWGPSALGVLGPLGVATLSGFPIRHGIAIPLAHAMAIAFLVVLVVVSMRRRRRATGIDRRRIHWVMLGFVGAATPPLTIVALSLLDQLVLNDSLQLYQWIYPSLSFSVLIPLAISVAIVRHDFFDVERILSATVSYNLVLILGLAAALGIMPVAGRLAASVLGTGSDLGQVAAAALIAVLSVAAATRLHPRVDRTFFPERYALQHGTADLMRRLATLGDGPAIVAHVADELQRLVHVRHLVVYRAIDTSALVPTAVVGRTAPESIEADSPLVATLLHRRKPLCRSVEHRDRSPLAAFGRAALAAFDAEVLVPIIVGDRLAATLCLGPKSSGDVYTSTDLAHLGSIAEAMAMQLGRLADDAKPTNPSAVFRRDGDSWTIAYAGKELRLRDLRGLHYLVMLLREPNREFHATDLVRSGRGPLLVTPIDDTLPVTSGVGDAGEHLDARARAAYKARLAELDQAIAEAEHLNDLGHLERAREERGALLDELGAAARGKRVGSDAERARLTATKGIKAALDKIGATHPELGAHLRDTVRRGYFCAYCPDPRRPIEWET